jgi:hypothetical protein
MIPTNKTNDPAAPPRQRTIPWLGSKTDQTAPPTTGKPRKSIQDDQQQPGVDEAGTRNKKRNATAITMVGQASDDDYVDSESEGDVYEKLQAMSKRHKGEEKSALALKKQKTLEVVRQDLQLRTKHEVLQRRVETLEAWQKEMQRRLAVLDEALLHGTSRAAGAEGVSRVHKGMKQESFEDVEDDNATDDEL